MSIWDDPELSSGGEYVKFEAVGDEVTGDVLRVGKHTFPDGKVAAEVVIRTDDGQDRTLTAGQVKLAAALKEQRPDAGDRIRVVFTEVEKRPGGKTMKHFDVKVLKGQAKGTAAAEESDDSEVPF
jgi:hypothetical protein